MTGDTDISIEVLIERLRQRRADALSTLELLEDCRQQVEFARGELESPAAVLEYVAFFVDLIGRANAECERIEQELNQGVQRRHIDALRQIASHCVMEQRRCLFFRDKWINKPLPHERVRGLLNEISVTTRDQLTAFRDLDNAAAKLEALIEKARRDAGEGFDRRALFTRIFRQ